MSPPPLRVSTTQFVVIDWQNSICRSQPPPKKGIEKAVATTKVTLRVTNYISIQYSLHQCDSHITTLSIRYQFNTVCINTLHTLLHYQLDISCHQFIQFSITNQSLSITSNQIPTPIQFTTKVQATAIQTLF